MSQKEIRVQDDLYEYVNHEWLEQAVIPDDKPTTGGFSDLDKEVEELLMHDFDEMESGKVACPDKQVERAVALYALAKDTKKRNRDGVRPVLKSLGEIKKLNGITALNRNLKKFVMAGYPLPFTMGVDADMKDTSRHCVMLAGPSVILPDTTYYKEGMEQQKEALLGIWSKMVSELLTYTKLTEEEQAQYLRDVLAFDEILAGLVKSSEEWSEYTKMYNPMKLRRVSGLMKPLKFRKLMVDLFGDRVPEEVIIAEPRFFASFSTVLNEETFPLYQHWAYIKRLLEATPLLSEKLREIGSTYSRALSGVAVTPSIAKQAYRLASKYFSEPIGLYYGRKYFGEEAKRDVVDMVKEIIETYKVRVSKNEILSPETKEKAILKLDKIVIKMGYPDKADALYEKMVFDGATSLLAATAALDAIALEDNFSKLGQPVDRTKWVMPGHMVNACYNPTSNDITFPAAILQPPFYSIRQSRSTNLGGIGAVIGHEISHAFDNNGAWCDENGNLNNWWTKADFKKFAAKTKAMIREFEGIELPWGKVNASFIVSENIADNGGMAVTLEIMSHKPDADYEAYFYNWARVWCMKARPEYLALLLQVDVHGPAVLRANMQPRNFDEWYTTFGVKKSDKMYIAPSKRVVIW